MVSFQIFISIYTVTLCFFVLLINSAFGCVGSLRASLAAASSGRSLAVAAGLLFAASSLVAEHGF